MRHWIEVVMPSPGATHAKTGSVGIAFHETWKEDGTEMPPEIHYCDCSGAGRRSHSVQQHRTITEGKTKRPETADEWKARHAWQRCAHRRQIFVDVTKLDMDWRPDGEHRRAFDDGCLRYDESVNGWVVAKPGLVE